MTKKKIKSKSKVKKDPKSPKIPKSNSFTPVPNNHIEQEKDPNFLIKLFPELKEDPIIVILISTPIILFILTILWVMLN